MRFLLDTNILSEPVVAQPNPFVLDEIRVHSTSLAIASVTWHEALYGMFLLPPGAHRGLPISTCPTVASDHRVR